MPYIVLEAAAAGMPMIATAVGGVPEIFGPHANRLVPPGNVDALAAAMTEAYTDPAEMAAATQRAARHGAKGTHGRRSWPRRSRTSIAGR